MPETVRFSRIVDACGRPHVHTLWTQPEKDPELKRARDAHRVMTVHRARGKSDAAVVGFAKKTNRNDQYLIFPKSLLRFDGARVVGVKFELVEHPKLDSIDAATWAAAPAKKKNAASAFDDVSTRVAAPASATGQPASTRTARHAPPRKMKRASSRTSAPPEPRPASPVLAREVRAALKELKSGKTVAAYHRLERALGK